MITTTFSGRLPRKNVPPATHPIIFGASVKKEGPEEKLPAPLPEVNLCFCALSSCLDLHEESERCERELRNEEQKEENRDFHEEERHQLRHKV